MALPCKNTVPATLIIYREPTVFVFILDRIESEKAVFVIFSICRYYVFTVVQPDKNLLWQHGSSFTSSNYFLIWIKWLSHVYTKETKCEIIWYWKYYIYFFIHKCISFIIFINEYIHTIKCKEKNCCIEKWQMTANKGNEMRNHDIENIILLYT